MMAASFVEIVGVLHLPVLRAGIADTDRTLRRRQGGFAGDRTAVEIAPGGARLAMPARA
jgi:hypothetical protein